VGAVVVFDGLFRTNAAVQQLPREIDNVEELRLFENEGTHCVRNCRQVCCRLQQHVQLQVLFVAQQFILRCQVLSPLAKSIIIVIFFFLSRAPAPPEAAKGKEQR
jgi:hypothetical protein